MESSQFNNHTQPLERIERLETRGGSCDTFLVKLYGKLLFLKRLKPEYVNDIRYREALRKEFETGFRLEHPHLVRYLSMEDDGLLMEYVDGETLTQRLNSNPEYFHKRRNTDKFVSQLLDVVGYLHRHQVIHLDLKPDNIMLTRINNDLKLIDLGCCYTDTFADTPGHTDAYAAPEQLSGGETDERTDIYAIGKILQLFPYNYLYHKVARRCTVSNPADRYQSADEIAMAISASYRRRRFYLLSLLSALILALLFLLFTLRPKQTDTPLPAQQSETSSVKAEPAQKDTTPILKGIVESQPQPVLPVSKTKTATDTSQPIRQLRADIRNAILPKYNETVGALPDSIMPGSRQWAEACSRFEPMITATLKEQILAHPSIPMETVAKELNDDVQSLLTLKMNKAMTLE